MRVEQIAALAECLPDRLRALRVRAEAAGKFRLHGPQHPVGDGICSRLGKLLHIAAHLFVRAGQQGQKPFEIRRDQDIHRRRSRLVKRPVAVIGAGLDKVGQDVILVRRADEPADGHAHPLRVEAGENVAEVACRDAEIDARPGFDGPSVQQVAVGRDVIHDLRQEPAPVDGVGRGQEVSAPGKLPAQRLVGENALHAGLRVVKVAAHGAHADVFTLLRDHLQLLHFGNAAVGIEHKDFRAVHIAEALKRGLARVAGGRDEDADGLLLARFPERGRQQIRQHLQRHILECARRPVPQLLNIRVFRQLYDGRCGRRVKFRGAVGAFRKAQQLLLGKLVEIALHESRGPFGIGKRGERFDLVHGELRNFLRQIQPAVTAEALDNGLTGR